MQYYRNHMPADVNMMGTQHMQAPAPVFHFDPYVYQTLQSVMGKNLVVETVKDTLRGRLMDVKPDHIAVQSGDEIFFIRIAQIVTIMPD
ncbi:YuzF family protein [Bacillus infantis]|uniref:YuzF family protein n=1 Tax=Bacillus infantis TaxID=324767 RepID=UPI00209FF01A|nr:YuzF family protein [Bacillus infantis]MCP1159207.1 YuzF family protein [Bacillus infantis]MCR6611627.1 YuzF family protein [Bacillus infantis]